MSKPAKKARNIVLAVEPNANENRADWAQAAVEAYADEHGNATREEALRDLMVNLLHLTERFGFDVKDAQASAFNVYTDERSFDGSPVVVDRETGEERLDL